MNTLVIVLIFAAGYYARGSQDSNSRLCIFVNNNVSMNHIPDEELQDSNFTEIQGAGESYRQEKCQKATNFCYALWKEDYIDNTTIIRTVSRGCWESSGNTDCKNTRCVGGEVPSPIFREKNYKFCCCSGDLCNVNVSSGLIGRPTYSPEEVTQLPPSDKKLIYIMPVVLVIVCLLICGGIWYFIVQHSQFGKSKLSPDSIHLMENGTGNSGSSITDHLKLSGIIGQGRFGSVWKGTFHDKEVAVKIFPSHYRTYFNNECDLYSLPFMDVPALLGYYGCDERIEINGCVEYLLVLSYAPHGSLQNYLRSNVLDWPTFCKMCLSVAKGLAHLHTDITKGDKVKPSITHRDFNTRNILVKQDLSCCICDLGFAMKIQGSKYYYNGEEQHAETKSINDVGTLRYMAPEVLEGAVNLRDCESSLKQIDIYALGLVLWELATRCGDLYHQPSQVEPYRLPFEAEVGHHPTFEQMQVVVTRHKSRPLFPEFWRDWTVVRVLKETTEDCWDQDAEARLTALCVEERLQELPTLWDRQRGVSPTVNSTFPGNSQIQGINPIRTSVENNFETIVREVDRTAIDTGHLVQSPSHSSIGVSKDTLDSAVSDRTVETTVTMSPTEPSSEHPVKNSNHSVVPNVFTSFAGPHQRNLLQPYQGRNPCMERNLMMQTSSEEELICNGNNLVDKSLKHVPHYYPSSPFESQSLVSNDFLGITQSVINSCPRPVTPIPYLQNDVHDSYPTVPKQLNVPGNGTAHTDSTKSGSRWMSWANNSGKWDGLKKFIGTKKNIFASKNPVYKKDLESVNSASQTTTSDRKSNLLIQKKVIESSPELKKPQVVMETQVSLAPCGINGGITTKSNGIVTSIMSSVDPNNKNEIFIEEIKCMSDDAKEVEEDTPNLAKCKRPSTLPLVSLKSKNNSPASVSSSRQSLDDHFQQVFGSKSDVNSSRLKDPHSRVKTPGDVPPSVRRIRGRANAALRFSLYDDRIMCTDDTIKTYPVIMTSSSSVNLSNSVPSNIDISSSCESGKSKDSITELNILNEQTTF